MHIDATRWRRAEGRPEVVLPCYITLLLQGLEMEQRVTVHTRV